MQTLEKIKVKKSKQQKAAEYRSALDELLKRIISGETSKTYGFTRRLATVAEAHNRTFVHAKRFLRWRLKTLVREGVYSKEQVAKIAPEVRNLMGLNDEF